MPLLLFNSNRLLAQESYMLLVYSCTDFPLSLDVMITCRDQSVEGENDEETALDPA